jgi:hypothetical protein
MLSCAGDFCLLANRRHFCPNWSCITFCIKKGTSIYVLTALCVFVILYGTFSYSLLDGNIGCRAFGQIWYKLCVRGWQGWVHPELQHWQNMHKIANCEYMEKEVEFNWASKFDGMALSICSCCYMLSLVFSSHQKVLMILLVIECLLGA